MSCSVVVARVTTGTEPGRILDAYSAKRPTITYHDHGDKRWFDFDGEHPEARAQLGRDLDSISRTWTIHLRVLEP
jgi:hypothetical protein